MKCASEGFRVEISTPRPLLRSLGPLPETSARHTSPNFRVPQSDFPVLGAGSKPVLIIQGQIYAQGILHLRNPNLGPNSAKRILDARISDPNSWIEFFGPFFSRKRGPLKNSPSRNSPPKIHLPKFNPEIGPKNSHCTSAGPLG